MFKNVRELIVCIGGPTIVAEALNLAVSTVSDWGSRDSIDAKYWKEIVELAKRRRVRGVTLEALALLHAREVAA